MALRTQSKHQLPGCLRLQLGRHCCHPVESRTEGWLQGHRVREETQGGSGQALGSAGVGSHGAQLRITTHGFGPGPPSLALACSRTLISQFTLHCHCCCACNSWVGIVPMLHAIAGCWNTGTSSASPPVLTRPHLDMQRRNISFQGGP